MAESPASVSSSSSSSIGKARPRVRELALALGSRSRLLCAFSLLPILLISASFSEGASAGIGPDPPGAAEISLTPTASYSYRAKIMISTASYQRPDPRSKRAGRLKVSAPWTGGAHTLMVLGSKNVFGQRWVNLQLGRRPNGSSAWVPASRLLISRINWRVTISLRSRVVRVFKSGRLVKRFKTVIGAPATPTPTGQFAIYEKSRQPAPDGFIGPLALHLTAHSNVLDNFGGGPGRIAIHGRGAASLSDPLGSAASHGCLRINNSRILWLGRKLPIGTPVRIFN